MLSSAEASVSSVKVEIVDKKNEILFQKKISLVQNRKYVYNKSPEAAVALSALASLARSSGLNPRGGSKIYTKAKDVFHYK